MHAIGQLCSHLPSVLLEHNQMVDITKMIVTPEVSRTMTYARNKMTYHSRTLVLYS